MKLTREQAIDLSIELWEWCAKTGKQKHRWFKWKEFGVIEGHCFLCEYQEQEAPNGTNCTNCPFMEKSDSCYDTYFADWCKAKNVEERKKYAALFLEQLKELKK